MSETSEAPIVQSTAEAPPMPSVAPKPSPREVSVPENAQGRKDVDLLIVFGQGPVKPLFVPEDIDRIDELCKQKGIKLEGKDKTLREEWEEFKLDPLHNQEPDFRVLEGKYFLDKLEGLDDAAKEKQMIEWQRMGRLGLNRYARQIAIAAGTKLVSGEAKRVLISAGRTLPPWAGEVLSRERIMASPSEPELFADIIRSEFGSRFKGNIDDAIRLEGVSTNSLLSFALILNENPDILNGTVELLGADYHVARILQLAKLFTSQDSFKGISAQQVLTERLGRLNERRAQSDSEKPPDKKKAGSKDNYDRILQWMTDSENKDYRDRAYEEGVWRQALEDPKTLNYWLGFIGVIEDPRVLQKTIERLGQDKYRQNAIESFRAAGLDFADLAVKDLINMDPKEFGVIADKLKILTTKDFRTFPEEAKSIPKRLVPADSLV